ncbi:MAG TPA: hypothetical protein VJ837_05970, partial [Candidatus Paceibacterota bacterium]|nr:hypothetical protein [Candidatus Paceibacterota bacterium]
MRTEQNGKRTSFQEVCGALLVIALVFGLDAPSSAYVRPGTTRSVSVPDGGTNQRDAIPTGHIHSDISGNGRFVVFGTSRKGLAPGRESPANQNLFVRDMKTGDLALVTVSPEGVPLVYPPSVLGYGSGGESISHDGRHVAFFSDALNLVRGDTNLAADVFVRDMDRGNVVRVSVSTDEEEANGPSTAAAISGNGRFVAFQSSASNLVPGDTNGESDVFVRDLKKETTERISISSKREQANDFSGGGSISSTGRFIVFSSWATNLVPDDTNGTIDVFVRDRVKGRTERVSVSSLDEEGNDLSGGWLSVSDDGRHVAFRSLASNLVPVNRTGLGLNGYHIYVRDRRAHRTQRVDV